jgi:hypothetical protein
VPYQTLYNDSSIMIWDCMAIHSVRLLSHVDKRLYKRLYKRIMVKALPKAMATYSIVVREVTLQHGNDPKHKSKR